MKSKNILGIGIILMTLASTVSASTTPAKTDIPAKPDSTAKTEHPSYFRCLSSNQDIAGLFVTQSDLPGPAAAKPTPTPVVGKPTPTPTPGKATAAKSTPAVPVYKEEPLVIPGAVRSQLYSYLSDKPLKIIRHVGNKIILLSTLDMVHAPHLALLLFMPSKDTNTLDIRVIDDGVDTFPGGGVEIFNFSHIVPTFDFETTAGKQSLDMDPGSSKIIPLQFEPNSTAAVSIKVPGKSSPTFTSAWDMFSSIRYMAFVVDDPNDKSNIKYTRVPDNVTNLKMDLARLEKPVQQPKPTPTPTKQTKPTKVPN